MPDLEDYWKDLRPVDEKAEAQERRERRLWNRAAAKVANFGMPYGTDSNKATRKVIHVIHTLLGPMGGFTVAAIIAWDTPSGLPLAILGGVFFLLWAVLLTLARWFLPRWERRIRNQALMAAADQAVQDEMGEDESARRRSELARLIREGPSQDELEQAEVEAVEAADEARQAADAFRRESEAHREIARREAIEARRRAARAMRFGRTYGVSGSELQESIRRTTRRQPVTPQTLQQLSDQMRQQVFAPVDAAMQDMSRQITEMSRGMAAMVENLTPEQREELMRTGHITIQDPSNPNATIHRVERSQVDEINEALEAIRDSPASSIPLPGVPPEAFDGIISDWNSSGEPTNREALDKAVAEREAEIAKINQTLGNTNSTPRPNQWERLLGDDEGDGV